MNWRDVHKYWGKLQHPKLDSILTPANTIALEDQSLTIALYTLYCNFLKLSAQ
ncbi:MAG: hypothetical protein ACFE0I_02060 [Elainellaceae cyanobacterium]